MAETETIAAVSGAMRVGVPRRGRNRVEAVKTKKMMATSEVARPRDSNLWPPD